MEPAVDPRIVRAHRVSQRARRMRVPARPRNDSGTAEEESGTWRRSARSVTCNCAIRFRLPGSGSSMPQPVSVAGWPKRSARCSTPARMSTVTVVLDPDEEVCRIGYGDQEGLEILQRLAALHQLRDPQAAGTADRRADCRRRCAGLVLDATIRRGGADGARAAERPAARSRSSHVPGEGNRAGRYSIRSLRRPRSGRRQVTPAGGQRKPSRHSKPIRSF